VLDMTPDWLLVPSQVEVQQEANRFIELGVYFDTFDDGVNRAAFNNITYRELSLTSAIARRAAVADPLCSSPQSRPRFPQSSPPCRWVTTRTTPSPTVLRPTRTLLRRARLSIFK